MVDQHRTEQLFRRAARVIRQLSTHPTPEGIHLLRTTVRRLETLFEQLTVVPDRNQKRVLKRLMKLRRKAGRIRDLDVQMAALRTLKIGSDGSRKDALMQDLARERGRREKKLVRALEADAIDKLVRRLPRVAAQLPLFPPESDGDFDPVRQALDRFAALARERGHLDETNLHAFRVDCKRVRYLAEMEGDTPRAGEVVGRLKAVQDAIGVWHDWDVLAQRAEKLFTGESPLISALKNVRNAKLHDALRMTTANRRELLRMRREMNAARKKPAIVVSPRRAAATA